MESTGRLEGEIQKIVFHNPDNLFTVARIKNDSGVLTIVGNLAGIPEHCPIVCFGTWAEDKKFGKQFKATHYEIKVPDSLLGIERYLGSGMVKGIGPGLAKRIVDSFGHDTLLVIEKSPNRLTEVNGIGSSRAQKISQSWNVQKDIQDVMIFLRGHNVAPAVATKIYKRYGKDSIRIISENPYRLAIDIWGVGFKTADQIAQNLGVDKGAPERLEAGVLHVLGNERSNGHCHAPKDKLLEQTSLLLNVEHSSILETLPALAQARYIKHSHLENWGECVSLSKMAALEEEAAKLFTTLSQYEITNLKTKIEKVISAFEKEHSMTLAPEQKNAIATSAKSKCSVITGGPGVGKTTIVKMLCEIFKKNNTRMELAAPTGRAAKRLSETTGHKASTIHRLLEYQPGGVGFERNQEKPLDLSLLILDEASMLDIELFHAVLAALPLHAKLILVGDVDQLPSVGPGSVLFDIIESESVPVTKLTQIFRQAAQSNIVTTAHNINNGLTPNLNPPKGDSPTRSDFYFIERAHPIAAADTIIELVKERIPKKFGYDPITDIQVLSPMHRGDCGTMALNKRLSQELTPQSSITLSRGDKNYRTGDKVMQIKNNYENDVFNGDMGVIGEIHPDAGTLDIEFFGEQSIRIEKEELDQITHGFACTVHKSQGSEYPVVIIPLLTQHYMMLQRNLLYTAVTRGKKLVIIVGAKKALDLAIKNTTAKLRCTDLSSKIRLGTPLN